MRPGEARPGPRGSAHPFGSASLAFLRLTHGGAGAAAALSASIALWMVVPVALAIRRLARTDL